MSSFFPYLSMLDGEAIFGLQFDLQADAIPELTSLPAATKTGSNSETLSFRAIPTFPTATVQNNIIGDEAFVNAFLAKCVLLLGHPFNLAPNLTSLFTFALPSIGFSRSSTLPDPTWPSSTLPRRPSP